MRDEPLHSSQARSEYLCFPHLRACLFSQRERAKAHQELQTSKLGKGGLRGGKKEEKKKENIWSFRCFRTVANWIRVTGDGWVYVSGEGVMGAVTLHIGNTVIKQQVIHRSAWPAGWKAVLNPLCSKRDCIMGDP